MARIINSFNFIKDTSLENIYISLESKEWKIPKLTSLFDLKEIWGIKEPVFNNEHGVLSVSIEKQMEEPMAPPGTIVLKSYIAIDDNYLYVWTNKRWKRIILNEW